MKPFIKLKISEFILIALEFIICGIFISQIVFNNFPMISGFLLIILILVSITLIIYLSYRDRQN